MELPTVKHRKQTVHREIVSFRGLDLSGRGREGTLSDCRNLSARSFPALAPRLSRKAQTYQSPTALFAWDGKPLLVDGERLLYDGEEVARVDPGEKQFAVVNTKLVIWPDKLMLDLGDNSIKKLDGAVQAAVGTKAVFTDDSVTIDNARGVSDGKKYATSYSTEDEHEATNAVTRVYRSIRWSPESGWELELKHEAVLVPIVGMYPKGIPAIEVGDYVLLDGPDTTVINSRSVEQDFITGNVTYGAYNATRNDGIYGEIVKIEVGRDPEVTDPARLAYANITLRLLSGADPVIDCRGEFSEGDMVQISGCVTLKDNNTEEDVYREVLDVSRHTITFKPGTFTPGEEEGQVKVSRSVPDLDFICESENRLWGVSNQDKTIYASALGDPKNFHTFAGLSTDSYAVAVGSEGDFTALCKYGTGVLCWKERTLHKILGRYPAEYQLASYQYAGVQDGSHKSLVNLNEQLFYLGRDGVYVYTGGAPERISQAFGESVFHAGRAGTDGLRYYLSALDGMGKPHLLVYDLATGLWMEEDDTLALDFSTIDGHLLFISGDQLCTMDSGEEQVEWSATFSPFYESGQRKKRVSRLFLRLEVPQGALVNVRVRCDNGDWVPCDHGLWMDRGQFTGEGEQVYTIPIIPNRCDRFEVAIDGAGDCKLLSMVREYKTEAIL